MRAPLPAADIETLSAQFEYAPGLDRVRALREEFAAATPDIVAAILDEAAKFADSVLNPLNDRADADGCRIEQGRVKTASGHEEAWSAFVSGGWPTLDQPADYGGQGLPLAVAAAVQEVFDRSCPGFGMLLVPQRSAARLIAVHGDPVMQQEWLPRLASGEWGATICISEADAGSDAGRIRTRAEPDGAGGWLITGEKMWISFGDHDLTERIGHCLLARTPDGAPGGAGLSLFLVPDRLPSPDGGWTCNAIVVRRIEEKMGLHVSPTCALGFEGAQARMIGLEGRGLVQMFVMITNMRLSVGVQGLGIASGALDVAARYAAERRQGGPVDAPVPIQNHADVQRMLFEATARVETLRGLIYALANYAEIAASETDPDARADAAALLQWLLPVVKTTGGEYAFETADLAIQILGGAGYTREWPVEQALRDARVLTIFEGTTGIQALDLVHRRLLRGDRRGLSVFLALARAAQINCADAGGRQFARCLDLLEDASAKLQELTATPMAVDAGATAYLHLAALAATGWIAARLTTIGEGTPVQRRLSTIGRYWLSDIGDRASLLHAKAIAGADALASFQAIEWRG